MPAIPTTALAMARTQLEGLLSDTCTVKRTPEAARSASGATTYGAATTIATLVPVRVELLAEAPDDMPRLAEGERYENATHNLFFAHDADVQELDTIEITGSSATPLRIIGLGDRQTQSMLLQAIASERT